MKFSIEKIKENDKSIINKTEFYNLIPYTLTGVLGLNIKRFNEKFKDNRIKLLSELSGGSIRSFITNELYPYTLKFEDNILNKFLYLKEKNKNNKIYSGIISYFINKTDIDKDYLGKIFTAEQLIAVLGGVVNYEYYNANKSSPNMNKCYIIGDTMGFGKGRILSGIMRYALKNNKKIVFFTEKSSLFSDIIRDIIDVHIDLFDDIYKEITSLRNKGNLSEKSIDSINRNIKNILDEHFNFTFFSSYSSENDILVNLYDWSFDYKSYEKEKIREKYFNIINDSKIKLLSKSKIILTTYSTFSSVPNDNNQRLRNEFFNKLYNDPQYIFIFDESHNIFDSRNPEKLSNIAINIIENILCPYNQFVFFASATYSKDISNLYPYIKMTDLGNLFNSLNLLSNLEFSNRDSGMIDFCNTPENTTMSSLLYIKIAKEIARKEDLKKKVISDISKHFVENGVLIRREKTITQPEYDNINKLLYLNNEAEYNKKLEYEINEERYSYNNFINLINKFKNIFWIINRKNKRFIKNYLLGKTNNNSGYGYTLLDNGSVASEFKIFYEGYLRVFENSDDIIEGALDEISDKLIENLKLLNNSKLDLNKNLIRYILESFIVIKNENNPNEKITEEKRDRIINEIINKVVKKEDDNSIVASLLSVFNTKKYIEDLNTKKERLNNVIKDKIKSTLIKITNTFNDMRIKHNNTNFVDVISYRLDFYTGLSSPTGTVIRDIIQNYFLSKKSVSYCNYIQEQLNKDFNSIKKQALGYRSIFSAVPKEIVNTIEYFNSILSDNKDKIKKEKIKIKNPLYEINKDFTTKNSYYIIEDDLKIFVAAQMIRWFNLKLDLYLTIKASRIYDNNDVIDKIYRIPLNSFLLNSEFKDDSGYTYFLENNMIKLYYYSTVGNHILKNNDLINDSFSDIHDIVYSLIFEEKYNTGLPILPIDFIYSYFNILVSSIKPSLFIYPLDRMFGYQYYVYNNNNKWYFLNRHSINGNLDDKIKYISDFIKNKRYIILTEKPLDDSYFE